MASHRGSRWQRADSDRSATNHRRARIRLQLSDDEVAMRREGVAEVLSGFHIARMTAAVLARAADPFPTLVRTLDAIHLATASLVRVDHEDLVFATHDRQLATAARALGFSVIGAARATG